MSDTHANLARRRDFFSRLFQFEQAEDPQGQDRDTQILGQQTDAFAKGKNVSLGRMPALRKYQDTVPTIDGLTSVGKTLPETRLTG